MTKELSSRLASLRIDMPTQTAGIHLVAIRRELVDPGPVVTPLRRTPRRRLVAVLAAVFVLLLPAAAIASDDAVPGDVLYPVKRSAEWAWSFVDPGVRARHRVEELETVIARNAPLDEVSARLADAEAALTDGEETELLPRLERARDRVRAQYGPGGSQQGSGGSSGAGPGSTDPDPTTTAPSAGESPDSGTQSRGSTTTLPASGGGGNQEQERNRGG